MGPWNETAIGTLEAFETAWRGCRSCPFQIPKLTTQLGGGLNETELWVLFLAAPSPSRMVMRTPIACTVTFNREKQLQTHFPLATSKSGPRNAADQPRKRPSSTGRGQGFALLSPPGSHPKNRAAVGNHYTLRNSAKMAQMVFLFLLLWGQ